MNSKSILLAYCALYCVVSYCKKSPPRDGSPAMSAAKFRWSIEMTEEHPRFIRKIKHRNGDTTVHTNRGYYRFSMPEGE